MDIARRREQSRLASQRWRERHPERNKSAQLKYTHSPKGQARITRYESTPARKLLKYMTGSRPEHRLRRRIRMQELRAT